MGAVPTVTIIGPGGELVCNESDLESFRAQGYVTKAEHEAKLAGVGESSGVLGADDEPKPKSKKGG